MDSPVQVVLIGGPPGAGKTTLGAALAGRLGVTALSVDDLVAAAQAITTPDSHPGLHVMRRLPSLEYFTRGPPERLIADATQQHEAVWPLAERVIRKHAAADAAAIVIDGWHLRPSHVARLDLEGIWAVWIVPAAEVLEERERENPWNRQSRDPRRMLENFLARSRWFTDLVEREATELGLPILRQDGRTTVDELCDRVLEALGARAPRSLLPPTGSEADEPVGGADP